MGALHQRSFGHIVAGPIDETDSQTRPVGVEDHAQEHARPLGSEDHESEHQSGTFEAPPQDHQFERTLQAVQTRIEQALHNGSTREEIHNEPHEWTGFSD